MIVDVNEERLIVLKNVFEPIVLVTEDGQKMCACMRDGGFEIGTEKATYKVMDGEMTEVHMLANDGQVWLAVPRHDISTIAELLAAGYSPRIEFCDNRIVNLGRLVTELKDTIFNALVFLEKIVPGFKMPDRASMEAQRGACEN